MKYNKMISRKHFQIVVLISILLSSMYNSLDTCGQSIYLDDEVNYLSKTPIIDGVLDSNLISLQPRTLPVVYKNEDSNPDIEVSYRIAYGAEFFYVYVEAEAEKLVCRDRAFQNGDGFHMVLAKPKPNNQSSDEFYVLACSAVDRQSMEWTRNIFWYYNVDNIFQRTSKDTKLMFTEQNGKISFELVLPWKDVYPYHPWISDGIGFNLCFVKAIGDQYKNTYKVLDAPLGAENSNREYLKLKFQDPEHTGEPETVFVLNKNNIESDDTLSGTSVTVASGDSEEYLIVKIMSGENNLIDYIRMPYDCKKGLTKQQFDINNNPVAPGGYKIDWYSVKNSSKGETYFTSLPEFSQEILNKEIEKVAANITPSSYYTLKHKAFEIDKELAEVKPYETCGNQRIATSQLLSEIDNGKNGIDDFAEKRGFVRKAYQSKLDQTLLPYMVYVPEDYDPKNTYPLFVYLHGSASDETNLLGVKQIIPDGFIALAPNGRGPSNCFAWDNAQTDISEAIDAVISSYSVDEDNIFLSGFSMGGYGVYRTYYETPEKFKALAIFSGHPNIANQWSDGEDIYPDFTQQKYLREFNKIPIFIFHGKEDRNCSFSTTDRIVDLLKKSGTKIKFVTEEDKGHEPPAKETVEVYKEWVKTTTKN